MDNDDEHEHETFLKYFINIDRAENVEIAMNLFETHIDFLSLNINKKRFKIFLSESINLYRDIAYHNSDHALNVLNSAAYFLKLVKNHKISQTKKLIYLLASYLHDIDHPGSTNIKNNCIELERYHVKVIKQQMDKFSDVFGPEIMKNMDLLSDLVYSTNLIYHDEILEDFTMKYFDESLVLKDIKPEITEIELKSLIKISDLSNVYKRFDNFKMSSLNLNLEVKGDFFEENSNSLNEDLVFLRRIACLLVERFSGVFHNFKFLSENCKFNIRQLLCEIKNI